MRLPLPGPSEVVALLGSLRQAVTSALDLVPRMTMLVDQLEMLLARVQAMVDSVEQTVDGAARTVEASALAVGTVDGVLRKVGATQRRADDAVAGAQGLVNRLDPLLSSYEDPLRTLAPVLARLAGSTSEQEVTAAVDLVDRLPKLIAHVDEDVLPLLAQLEQVGPDVHELLEVTQDLRRVITGLPGVGFLRRREDDELPSEQEPG